jgi:condensation enzyme
VMAAVSALGGSMRSTTFMVLLAAFNVLAYQINGTTDPVITAVSNGRSGPQFHETVGPFLNFLPLRTDMSECETFRDVIARTRQTCIEAYSHEIPIEHIERELPELMQPLKNPRMCDITVSQPQSDHRVATAQIADGSQEIRELQELEPISSDIPGGLAWAMEIPSSGNLSTYVQYDLEDFDERTITGWTSAYRDILSRGADQPDREWKTL